MPEAILHPLNPKRTSLDLRRMEWPSQMRQARPRESPWRCRATGERSCLTPNLPAVLPSENGSFVRSTAARRAALLSPRLTTPAIERIVPARGRERLPAWMRPASQRLSSAPRGACGRSAARGRVPAIAVLNALLVIACTALEKGAGGASPSDSGMHAGESTIAISGERRRGWCEVVAIRRIVRRVLGGAPSSSSEDGPGREFAPWCPSNRPRVLAGDRCLSAARWPQRWNTDLNRAGANLTGNEGCVPLEHWVNDWRPSCGGACAPIRSRLTCGLRRTTLVLENGFLTRTKRHGSRIRAGGSSLPDAS